MTHVLSVDVEDYFQVEAFAGSVDRKEWHRWPSRVVATPSENRLKAQEHEREDRWQKCKLDRPFLRGVTTE